MVGFSLNLKKLPTLLREWVTVGSYLLRMMNSATLMANLAIWRTKVQNCQLAFLFFRISFYRLWLIAIPLGKTLPYHSYLVKRLSSVHFVSSQVQKLSKKLPG